MLLKAVSLPVNILLSKGVPDFNELKQAGVKRVSLGSGFFKISLQAMKEKAEKLFQYNGLEDIIENPFPSDWVADLTHL